MKAQGWKSVKKAPDMWVNYCPKCAEKYARPGPAEFAGLKINQRRNNNV